jgi:flagellar M-ring protein FliF
MFETLARAATRVREVWNSMTLNQRVISGAIIAALLLVVVWMTTLGTAQNYTILSAQLDPKDASEITALLDQRNIPYKITQNGTAIEVPVDQADRLKMELSAQGLPGRGIVGYEILDTTNFGMSDFLQKVNYRRALEGELSRTLRTLDAVEDASVKIAIPEPSLYTDTRQATTASVTLKLVRGRTLPDRSVEAVTNLMASSVEGLDPDNVTVIDTRGTLLTRPNRDTVAMMTSTQMEMKVAADRYLAEKIKVLLDGAFGPGKALVTVNADLDFDRLERTSTSYDQDRSAIRSEERLTVTNADGQGDEENTVTNYENGSVVEKLVQSPGGVSLLTVSVLLDSRDSTFTDDRGNVQVAKVPWTAAQLASVRTICENAVGYNQGRGDRLVVENMEFGGGEGEAGEERMAVRAVVVDSVKAVTTGLVILAGLLLFFFLARLIAGSLDPSKVRIPSEVDFERKKADLTKVEEEEEETEKTMIVRKIVSKAVQNPEMIAKSIKSFYREPTP